MGAGKRPARRLILRAVLIAMLAMAGAGYAAWTLSFRLTLDRLATEGHAELGFLTAALEKDFNRYKLLAKALAQTGAVRRRARSDVPVYTDEADDLLLRMGSISGAAEIDFLTLATTPDAPTRAAVTKAYQGAIGLSFDHRNGGTFLISAPVWIDAEVAGAVVVRVQADALEFDWRALPKVVFLTDAAGQVQLSSLPALRLRELGLDQPESNRLIDNRLHHFAPPDWPVMGLAFETALVLQSEVPVLELKAFALIDPRPATRSAWLSAIAVSATVLTLILILAAIGLQRAAQRSRQVRDARAKAELELKIADRTIELTAEIAERRLTEKRLRATQDELVQAGKLSALGQLAAGIAHEINQPLAAIRGFAENASVFLARGRTAEAAENLKDISDLTDRAARIIRNLRAFARNQTEETTTISVADVIDDALSIMKARIIASNAVIDWQRPATDILAIGGTVRLQQVIVNLIANALDAQQDAAQPHVALALTATSDQVAVAVHDRGAGLTDEVKGRMFDPFFSTKSQGGEGLGLGLSISYGIMRGFGGGLVAANHPEGGAVMTATLRSASAQRKVA